MSQACYRLELEFNTPAFVKGARDDVAELRPASIRGVLRFWLRAVEGGRRGLRDVRRIENSLFGHAGENESRQGKVLLRVSGSPPTVPPGKPPEKCRFRIKEETSKGTMVVNPITYLGYGPYQNVKGRGQITARASLAPGAAFFISLLFREKPGPEELDALVRAAWAWTRFGGLGSRSRRGFGSIHLRRDIDRFFEHATGFAQPIPPPGVKNELLARSQQSGFPGFTCFSASMRLYTGPRQDSWANALGWLGRTWKDIRSHVSRTHGDRHDGSFRAMLGMPLLIKGRNLKIQDSLIRRASPFFLRVSREGKQFVPVILALPAVFHPDHPQLRERFREVFHDAVSFLSGQGDVEEIW